MNSTLRKAIEEAKRHDVPAATIKTTLKKLTDQPDLKKVHRHIYEGRLYGKLYLLIVVYSENLQTTRCQLGPPFRKHNFVSNNSKALFTERGVIAAVARADVRTDHFEDDCLNDAIECDAEEIDVIDIDQRLVTFYCEPNDLPKVVQKLGSCGYTINDSERVFIWDGPGLKLNDAEAKDYETFKGKMVEYVEGFDIIYDNVDDTNDDEIA